ncbi:hypothetical protein [Pseudomonas viridiflava]|uniref:hypothetical protein n=1 Tax=Pseudomonas viridiflava TaxID=33069 RepID=UPI00160544F7|nr:hypothetical protein [Pseudomonas viridiflava]
MKHRRTLPEVKVLHSVLLPPLLASEPAGHSKARLMATKVGNHYDGSFIASQSYFLLQTSTSLCVFN